MSRNKRLKLLRCDIFFLYKLMAIIYTIGLLTRRLQMRTAWTQGRTAVTAAADCTPVYIMRDEKCVDLISVGRNYCLVKRCRSLQR